MQFGPALRAAAGIAVLSIMDAVIKGMAAYYPTFQVAFLRFACGTLVVAGVVAVLRPGWPSRETVTANSIRSVIAVDHGGELLLCAGPAAAGRNPRPVLPVADVHRPVRAAPAAGAGRSPDRRRHRASGLPEPWSSSSGQTEEAAPPAPGRASAAALLSAVTYALSLVLLRQRAQRDKFLHIVIFQNIGPAILVAPFAALGLAAR